MKKFNDTRTIGVNTNTECWKTPPHQCQLTSSAYKLSSSQKHERKLKEGFSDLRFLSQIIWESLKRSWRMPNAEQSWIKLFLKSVLLMLLGSFIWLRCMGKWWLLDPILVKTEMSPDQRHGPRHAEAHNQNRARRRSHRGRNDRVTRSWDHRAGTEISESTRYNGRRRSKQEETLKTLERALHSYQSYCLSTFRFFLDRTCVYHSI